MHVLLFYPPVVLTADNWRDTVAATDIHRNNHETCSTMDSKNGECIAPVTVTATANGKVSDLGIDVESSTINASDGDEIEGEKEGGVEGGKEKEEEAGVDVRPLRAMEKVIRGSAESFRGRFGTKFLLLHFRLDASSTIY